MLESEVIVRTAGQKIDVRKSLHAFAMALGRAVQEEERIKNSKAYKKAIRAVLKRYDHPITFPTMIDMVVRELGAEAGNYHQLSEEVAMHIRFNAGKTYTIKSNGSGIFRKGRT